MIYTGSTVLIYPPKWKWATPALSNGVVKWNITWLHCTDLCQSRLWSLSKSPSHSLWRHITATCDFLLSSTLTLLVSRQLGGSQMVITWLGNCCIHHKCPSVAKHSNHQHLIAKMLQLAQLWGLVISLLFQCIHNWWNAKSVGSVMHFFKSLIVKFGINNPGIVLDFGKGENSNRT